MTLKLGRHTLLSSSQASRFTKDFFTAYCQGLAKAGLAKTSEATAVVFATHSNFYGFPVPASLFRGVVPERHKELVDSSLNNVDPADDTVRIRPPVDKAIGPFVSHFNSLRALRPLGEARKGDLPIDSPFNPNGFHFGKVQPPEIFLETKESGMTLSFLYNLFPLAPFHALLVPDRKANRPQYINDIGQLTFIWEFIYQARDPNLRIGYNSLGAHASVNQFHYQLFYNTTTWRPPIETLVEAMPKGVNVMNDWPLRQTTVFKGIGKETSLNEVFYCLKQLHAAAQKNPNTIAYNLYIMPEAIVLLPRAHQSTYADYLNTAGAFTSGPAFAETTGYWFVTTEAQQQNLTEAQIRQAYEIISL